MPFLAHAFVDGAYLRRRADQVEKPWANPRRLVANYLQRSAIQDWCMEPTAPGNIRLSRLMYYDARPDDDSEVNPDLRDYWLAVERLPDTSLGFGMLRGENPPRQKGVDTLLAVHMVAGAFTQLFQVALLVTGDADFVPAVNEVRRRGVMVALLAAPGHVSDDLIRSVDRYVQISPLGVGSEDFPAMKGADGETWPSQTPVERD